MRWVFGALALLPALVSSLASTDSTRDADASMSGYLPNHNIDPEIAGSSSFRALWTFTSPNDKELWLAKPLVWTPEGGSELVITSSMMNIIRLIDSKTGTVVNQRTLTPPYLKSDMPRCGDIPDYIGVTGTPIIDPATSIMYMFAKGYRDGAASGGIEKAIYQLYAVQLPSLKDVPGFPVIIDGKNADNDKSRYFVGGVALQRPSLTEVNGHIIGAFGSHCGHFNYTGYLVSVSKTPGVGVVSLYATEAAPGAPSPQSLDLNVDQGGKAGIWQSGFGLATVGNRVYITTGNGQGHANGQVPASGRVYMSTLDEVVASMEISASGIIKLVDYFQPYDYVNLDAADQDLGSSGLCVLDGSVFKGTGVTRMAVVAGKEGRVYVLNADNLGGFRNGLAGGDATIQTMELGGSLFGGFGSYPFEGGYIYAAPLGGNTQAFKFGHDANGKPVFSLAGKAATTNGGRGVGQATVTSNNGQPGTGILWVTDVSGGMKAYRAVPENGVLIPIPLPTLGGNNKYQRPVFGDGRVFVQWNNKRITAMGSPVAMALTCSSPVGFGTVLLGSSGTGKVTCTANTAITAVDGCSVKDTNFQCVSKTLPPGPIAKGATFSFDVIWDLASPATPVVPGFVSTSLELHAVVAPEFASSLLVSLEGTAAFAGPFLHATPPEVQFGIIVLSASDDSASLEGTVILENAGSSPLTFTGVAWKNVGSDDSTYTNLTAADLGSGFSSTEFPAAGVKLDPKQSVSVTVTFKQSIPGSYSTLVTVWSDGGASTVTLSAAVRNPPTITIQVSNDEGGWDTPHPPKLSFGNVLAGTSVIKQIRICNDGGSDLTVTISKAPLSPQLFATNPNHEFDEGSHTKPGECSIGNVGVFAAPVQPNHPSEYLSNGWTITTDAIDPLTGHAVGKQIIEIDATVVTQQVGPLLASGSARYQWVGCFKDTGSIGRNLVVQVNSADQQKNNTLQQCQSLCLQKGYILSGVQYHQECWCGGPQPKHPNTYSPDSANLCTFTCTGDSLQACGGDGGYMSLYADTTQFDIPAFLISVNATQPTASSSVPVPTSTSTVSTVSTVSTSSAITSSVRSSTSIASSSTTSSISSTSSTSSVSSASISSTSSSSSTSSTSSTPSSTSTTIKSSSIESSTVQPSTTSSTTAVLSTSSIPSSSTTASPSSTTSLSTRTSTSSTISSSTAPSTIVSSSTTTSTISSSAVATSTISPLNPNQPSVVSGQWAYVGCVMDLVEGIRTLPSESTASDTMTLEACAAFCSTGAYNGGAYNFFGTEYGRECFCGWHGDSAALKAPEGDCPNKCVGSATGLCGGRQRLSVFQNLVPNTPPPEPAHVAQVGKYQWVGCQTESTTGRALSGKTYASDLMTLDSCATFCGDGNWQLMGVEYGRECYCGNSANAGSVPAPVSECNMLCKNNKLQYCGAGGRLDLFTLAPPSSSTSSTVLTSSTASTSSLPIAAIPLTSSSVVISTSAAASSSTSSGAVSSSAPIPVTTSTSSSSRTSSSTSSNVISTTSSILASSTIPTSTSTSSISSSASDIKLPSSDAPASTSVSTTSSSTTSTSLSTTSTSPTVTVPTVPASTTAWSTTTFVTSTITSSGPIATQTDGYYYLGCYRDTSSGHALPHLFSNDSVTPELCIAYANSIYSKAPTTTRMPYLYLEYHHECYGGDNLDFMGSAVTSLIGTNACKDYCYGSVRQFTTDGTVAVTTETANYCGGPKMFDLYGLSTPEVFPTTGGPVVTAKA